MERSLSQPATPAGVRPASDPHLARIGRFLVGLPDPFGPRKPVTTPDLAVNVMLDRNSFVSLVGFWVAIMSIPLSLRVQSCGSDGKPGSADPHRPSGPLIVSRATVISDACHPIG